MFVSCFNCNQKCIRASHLPDGQPVFLKCRSPFRFICAADIQDYDFNLRCLDLVQKYGLCSCSAAYLGAFAIDLYQKGILTKEDTDGMHLEWGNPEVVPALMEKIARREGIGDVLANGVYQAARQIGRGAEQYVYAMRKLEPRGRQMHGFEAAVKWILNDRQDTTQWGGLGYEAWLKRAEKEDWPYPQEWKKDLPSDVTKMDYGMLSKTIAYDGELGNLRDIIGLCNRVPVGTTENGPIRDQAELISYATGLDLSEEELMKCARRARALIRAYNAILGERMKPSDLPEQFLRQNDDKYKLSQVVEETNKLMGYSPEGIPTKEALEELGLEYVAQELERREILPESVAVPVV